MQQPPIISVVTPVYNDARHLPRAVNSIVAQTFHDWELLIVDDGSTDNTLAVAHALAGEDARIHVIAVDHGGAARARNIGMKHARGEWIAVLDSDDYAIPERFERQLAFAAAHPSAGCIGAWAWTVSAAGRPLDMWRSGPQTVEEFRRARDAGEFIYFIHSTWLMRRDLLEQVGGYPEDHLLGEDLALLTVRLAPVTDCIVDPQPLVYRELHANSLTRRGARPRVGAGEVVMLNVHRRQQGLPELSFAEATKQLLAEAGWWGRLRYYRHEHGLRLMRLGNAELADGHLSGLFPLLSSAVICPEWSPRIWYWIRRHVRERVTGRSGSDRGSSRL